MFRQKKRGTHLARHSIWRCPRLKLSPPSLTSYRSAPGRLITVRSRWAFRSAAHSCESECTLKGSRLNLHSETITRKQPFVRTDNSAHSVAELSMSACAFVITQQEPFHSPDCAAEEHRVLRDHRHTRPQCVQSDFSHVHPVYLDLSVLKLCQTQQRAEQRTERNRMLADGRDAGTMSSILSCTAENMPNQLITTGRAIKPHLKLHISTTHR
jgi:hypothetical protein